MDELREIAAGEPKAYDRDSLETLAKSLHRNGFSGPAQAIARYLLDEYKTLDQAFGVAVARRGRPAGGTLAQDVAVLELRMGGKFLGEIASETGMDERNVRRLCSGQGKWLSRKVAALAEIIDRTWED